MLRIFKNLRKKDLLYILISAVFIGAQVWLDLKMPDCMTEITRQIQTPNNEMSGVLLAGGKMMLCALGSLLFAACVSVLAAQIATDFGADLRGAIYHKVLSFSKEEIGRFSTASLITATTDDVMQIQILIIIGMQAIIKAPLMGIWAIAKIAVKNTTWMFSIAVALVLLLTIAIFYIVLMLPRFREIRRMTDELNRVTEENLSGIRVIHSYNAEKYQEEKFEKANDDLTNAHLYVNRVSSIVMPTFQLIMSGLSLAIFWIGAALFNSVGTTERLGLFTDMIVFSQYAIQVVSAFMLPAVLFIILPHATESSKRILEVLDTATSVTDGTLTDENRSHIGEIEFINVSFRYPNAEANILQNISFKAHKGETIAFIGATGSGKSTLIDLIPRFYDVSDGEVLVDGVNVKEYTLKSLRNKIGYVSQNAILFSGSVRSNVVFGDAGHNIEQNFIESVYTAQASDFVEAMNGNYDAAIYQKGTNLSSVQKQCLSIARAVCRRPEILIFDDSFSALDHKTDRLLRNKLNHDCDKITKLIVTQRIGTVRDADRIIVLDEGKIVGSGKHSELMKSCEVYRQIADSQLSKEELT